jgi:uncharacterized membrane protein
MPKLKEKLSQRFHLFLTIAYVIVFSSLSILKHYNLFSYAYDLGIFMQSLWTTLHGKFFYETPDLFWNETGNYLSIHFSLVIFLLLPLYRLAPCAETLLIFQTLLIGFSGTILYKIALHVTGSRVFSNILLISYFSSASLHGANLYDFHMEAFIPLIAFLSTFYFIKGKVTIAILIATLLLFVIYTLAPLVILFLLYLVLGLKGGERSKYMPHIILSSAVASSYYMLVAYVILPVMGAAPFKEGTVSWFPELGKSWSEIIYNTISSPILILRSISYLWWAKTIYWVILFSPVAFLNLLDTRSFIPLSYWMLISWLTYYEPFFIVGWQYTLIPLPFIYLGAVFALRKVLSKHVNTSNIIKNSIIVAMVLNLIISPINPLMHNRFPSAGYDNEYVIPPRLSNLYPLIEDLNKDQDVKVLTTNNLFPHLANRLHTYVWLPQPVIPDYIIVDLRNIGRIHDKIGNTSFISQLQRLISQYEYGVYLVKDGILVLKLGYRGRPVALEPYIMRYNYRHLFTHSLTYTLDPTSESIIILSGTHNYTNRPAWFGPYTLLIAGTYLLKLRMKMVTGKCLDNTFIEVSEEKARISIARLNLKTPHLNKTMVNSGWYTFNMTFKLIVEKVYLDVEFRGWTDIDCKLYLDYIEVIGPL